MMTPNEMISNLRALGFADADQKLVSDKPVIGLSYLYRAYKGEHQYVSICTDEGRFLEAVVQVYATQLTPKARGVVTLGGTIAREWGMLVELVSRTYTPVEPSK